MVRKLVKSKQQSITSDSEPTETVEDIDTVPIQPVKALPVETSKQIVESVPESSITQLGEKSDIVKQVEVKIIPLVSVETNIIVSGDKEEDTIPVLPSKTSQAVLNIDTNEPVTVREANVQETTNQFTSKFKPLTFNATPGVTPSESVIVSEINIDQDIAETKTSLDQPKEAHMVLTTHEAAITQEIQPSDKEEDIQATKLPMTATAKANFIPQEGISVTEITQGDSEQTVPDLIKPLPVSPRVEIPSSESIEVTEIFSEIKPEKYYPELIVPTEVADESVVPGNKLVQKSEMLLPEKEGTFNAQKIPEEKHAEIKLSLDKSIIISEQQVHEKEEQFLPEKQIGKSTVSTTFTPCEGIEVSEIQGELKEQELVIDKVDEKKGDIVVDNKESIIASINIPIEREQSLSPESHPFTKKADLKLEGLETSNISETFIHESETQFDSGDRPKGIYPLTSLQPLESIEITETQPGDFPGNFVNPLKYSIDKANPTYETVESKQISEIVAQEKESPLEISEIPTPKTVTQDISGLKSVQITQTLPAEKEDVFKSPQTPESHKGRAVPGHPFHSLIVEEIHSENTTGEVKQESLPVQTVKIKQDAHQETIIQEVICDESVGETTIKKSETKSVEIEMIPEESIEVTEVLLNEKEKEYEQPQLPSQVFAEKSIRPQEAIETSEVVSQYESSRLSPETVIQSMAVTGTTPLESISVTQYETSEKETTLPNDILPEMKKATLDFHDEKREVCITQVEIAEKEENLQSADTPKSAVANTSISGHKIAVKTEILPEQDFENLTITEDKKRLASVGNVPHQEVVITEVNVSEQEKDLAKFKPGSKEATVTIIPEEAVNVTEVISADNESILVKDKKPEGQTASTVVLEQEVAEKSEIMANISTGVLEVKAPKEAQANISHDSLQHVISSEPITGERESEFTTSPKPSFKSANLNFEEEQALSVTEVTTTDTESPMTEKEQPKERFASYDIKGQKVAAVSEPFVEISTGEIDEFNPSVSKAESENIPFEAIVSTEVLPSEAEGRYNEDIKPDLKQAKPSFNEEIGVTVSIVTCEDKEGPLKEDNVPIEKARHSHTEGHPVASFSEIMLLGSSSDLEITKPKTMQANIEQSPYQCLVQNIVSPNEKEAEFEGKLKFNSEQANVSFEEGQSTTVFEVVTGQSEEELKKDIVPEKKCATVNFTEKKVAQTSEVICDVAVNDFKPNDIPLNKANVSHTVVESIITTEVDVKEKEGEYTHENILQDHQTAKPIIDENEILRSLVISQNIPEEKEEQFEGKAKPTSKTAAITLQEQNSLPTVEEVTLLDRTTPFLQEDNVERHAIPDIQNQTVVAQKYEVITNLSEGSLLTDKPKTSTATVQQDTFEGIVHSEILIQDTETKLNEEIKPSEKTANLNIETREAVCTLQVDVQDTEQNYTVEEPDEQKAKSEFIPNLVAEKIEIIPEQDLSEIITPVVGASQAKSTIIPHKSIIQSTTEVSESEKEFKDTFVPVGKTANIQITEDTSINVSEIQLADKEDALLVPEKQPVFQAHANITGQEVAITTETVPSLSVSDVKENVKHVTNTANIEQTTLSGLTQTQVHVLDKEQDFQTSTRATSQSATVTFEEGQSINVTTHTITDTADEFHVSEKPLKVSAKIEISTQDSIQQLDVRAESHSEPLSIDIPRTVNIVPTQTVLEGIGVSENIVQESESEWVDKKETKTSQASVKLEPQEVLSVSEIDVQEKEGALPTSKIPKLAQATPNVSEQKVAQKSEIIPESSTKELCDLVPETGNALLSTVSLEHLTQTQPSVQEPSEKEFEVPQNDLKTGAIAIESRGEIATKSEVLIHEKEKMLNLVQKPKLEKAKGDIIDQEALISSQNVPLEKTNSLLEFKSPKKISAIKECIPFESIEQAEVLVQESDDILNIEKEKGYKVKATFQEVESVNVHEVIPQEKEDVSKDSKLPTQEKANLKLTPMESLQHTEIVSDSSVADLPTAPADFKVARRGLPAEQQSVEVSMASTHESEGLLDESKVSTAKAPIVFEPLDSIQITEINPEENLGKCYIQHFNNFTTLAKILRMYVDRLIA